MAEVHLSNYIPLSKLKKKKKVCKIGFYIKKVMTVRKIISNNFYREIIEKYCQQQVYALRHTLRTRALEQQISIPLLFYHVYYNLIWKYFSILIR